MGTRGMVRRLTWDAVRWEFMLLPMLLATSAGAQQVPTITLRAPVAEHEEPLSEAGGLRELRDGRVLVVDSRERLLVLYDFAKGTATRVSRQGAGPLEYRIPGPLVAVGDSVMMMDLLQQRLLVIDPNGVPLRTQRLIPTGEAVTALARYGVILAADARGRFYSESRGMTIVTGKMPVMSDTIALVRWARYGVQGDTLAIRVEPAPMPKMDLANRSKVGMKVPIVAYQPRDTWAVFRDGTVAILRVADYHSEWIAPDGKRSVGARLAHVPVPVTERDKERVRKTTREAYEWGLKLGISMAGANARQIPKISLELEEPAPWPKVKPPFSSARAAPDGRLWVARATSDDELAEYDVVAPGGRLEKRVRFPKGVTLAGFGTDVLYAFRKDEDDLRYLQRYRLP